jgi:hypothetical protein
MVPLAAFPPTIPFTLQLSVVVVREGVNCCVAPARTFAVLGEMVRTSLGGGPGWVYPVGDRAQLEVMNIRITTNGASINERRTMPPQIDRMRN